ncbi:methionine ABC transporter ATP-binding protein [Clostridium autoethanogenum]|uniref:ATP-binding cassette domain-containing protein n=1 Tax=Clostridium autoethanogenum DSM 10061 TaxID=1341692 RepID=A0ABM5NWG4_9CLOT|nr:ATP-binding cassette domain-containing protein [Clostridium autoethanogenum]AGY76931.1 ATP-binding cassette domain-containing protein [Clostridium autoethanogenum DSM 10061]ALU37076.1 Phosphonate-transporting ATPase [Clostridium autoethanogenum DSM 10061]OVY48530.1 Methionine import ATP-binding protein MetN [Clostridium autoethanogenum]
MIDLKNVYKTFNRDGMKIEALKGISIKVDKGDIYGVIGFSGAGKSTLLRMVNFLEKPTSGSVLVNGQDISKLNKKQLISTRRKIGMVFQHFNLLNSKTVFANVALPLILDHVPKNEISNRVNDLLKFVGLDNRAKNYPDELSGGQKQRVGIARALATNPQILLCDEATSALDPQTTESILELLKRVNKEYDITILLITHQMNVIQKICNKVAVMEKGKIVEKGRVIDVFGNPKEKVTKDFVHSVTNDDIPISILNLIKNNRQNSQNRKFFRLKFMGNSTLTPMISMATKKFNAEINVLNASVTELQDTPMVNMVIELECDSTLAEEIVKYIESKNILVEEVA